MQKETGRHKIPPPRKISYISGDKYRRHGAVNRAACVHLHKPVICLSVERNKKLGGRVTQLRDNYYQFVRKKLLYTMVMLRQNEPSISEWLELHLPRNPYSRVCDGFLFVVVFFTSLDFFPS